MKQEFKLIEKDHKNIRIEFKIFFRDIKIFVDDVLIGEAKNSRELKEGKEFKLENGTPLKVYFKAGFGQSGFDVYYNYAFVPGSLSSVESQSKIAFGIMMYIGVVNAGGGILRMFYSPEFLSKLDAFGLIVYGLFFLCTGYFVKNGSVPAVVTGTVILILDFIITFMMMLNNQSPIPSSGMPFKVIIIIYMVQCSVKMVMAQKKLNKSE